MVLQNDSNRFPNSFYDIVDLPYELQRRPLVVLRSSLPITHTGDVNEKTLFSESIDKGNYGDNAIFEIFALFTMTNNANAKTFRFKFNNINVFNTVPATSRPSFQVMKTLFNRNSKTSQISNSISEALISGSSPSPNNLFNIDLSQGLKLDIAVQLVAPTDAVTLESAFLRVTY